MGLRDLFRINIGDSDRVQNWNQALLSQNFVSILCLILSYLSLCTNFWEFYLYGGGEHNPHFLTPLYCLSGLQDCEAWVCWQLASQRSHHQCHSGPTECLWLCQTRGDHRHALWDEQWPQRSTLKWYRPRMYSSSFLPSIPDWEREREERLAWSWGHIKQEAGGKLG